MDKREEREFFRIDDHLLIEYRKITQEEYAELADKIRYTPAPHKERLTEGYSKEEVELQKEWPEKEELYRYIQAIDRKLDIIIELLSGQKGEGAFIKTYQRLNISGSGIRFISEIELKEGDYVELRIALPTRCYSGITCLCRVVKSEKIRDDASSRWVVAMKFEVINEEERDLLINYIFTKERELIRHRKGAES